MFSPIWVSVSVYKKLNVELDALMRWFFLVTYLLTSAGFIYVPASMYFYDSIAPGQVFACIPMALYILVMPIVFWKRHSGIKYLVVIPLVYFLGLEFVWPVVDIIMGRWSLNLNEYFKWFVLVLPLGFLAVIHWLTFHEISSEQ